MKKFMIVLMFFFSAPTFATLTSTASSRLAEQTSIIKEMNSLGAEYSTLNKNEAKLAQRWKDLQWAAAQNKKQVNKFNQEFDQFKRAKAQYQRDVDSHNARCSGTYSDRNHIAKCNRARSEGMARKKRLISQGNHLDSVRKLLKESIRTGSEQTQKVFLQHKANTARMKNIKIRYNRLQAKLKWIQSAVNNCKRSITNSTRERMHDVCGQMFDGNKVSAK